MLLGIDHDYAFVDLSVEHLDRRPDFVAVSPFGEVPVLVRGECTYAQSNAILLMLSRDTGKLAGHDPSILERWLFWEANRIGFSVAILRWEIALAAAPVKGVVEMLRFRAQADLAFLDRHLAISGFIIGNTHSMADIACAAYLQFADEAQLGLALYPNVDRWMSRLAQIPGWEHSSTLLDPSRI